VILSDQRMPRMTGVELFERLRDSMPAAIRIIITGFVDVGAIVDAINRAGIYKFVVKPFDHHELKLTVDRAIETFEMRRQIERHVEELEDKVQQRTRELEEANQALRLAYTEIERASLTDPLTGLNNRRYVVGTLDRRERRAAAGNGHADDRSAFLLIDIDHFKSVNDTYGHAAGDAVLRGIAGVLREQCREGDLAARWGGEEFLLQVAVVDEAQALVLAGRVRCAVEAASFDLGDGRQLKRTCSIGVACWPFCTAQPLGWEQVVAVADSALYMAKRGGRNAALCLTADGELPTGFERALAEDPQGLLDRGELRVMRQP
jgi:diguanylate cyclase (GGDEF)-like protein